MGESRVLGIIKIRMMCFWHNERVPDIYRVNVEKSEDSVVFIDFGAGDFSRNDFAKETTFHT